MELNELIVGTGRSRILSECWLMVCDRCKEREAVCNFAYGGQPRGARTWNLCEVCLQDLAPGFPSPKQFDEKLSTKKSLARGETSCNWVSFSPEELRGKD